MLLLSHSETVDLWHHRSVQRWYHQLLPGSWDDNVTTPIKLLLTDGRDSRWYHPLNYHKINKWNSPGLHDLHEVTVRRFWCTCCSWLWCHFSSSSVRDALWFDLKQLCRRSRPKVPLHLQLGFSSPRRLKINKIFCQRADSSSVEPHSWKVSVKTRKRC